MAVGRSSEKKRSRANASPRRSLFVRGVVLLLLVSAAGFAGGRLLRERAVRSRVSDLDDHPELRLFFHEMVEFEGKACDPERGIFNFGYLSREKSVVRLFAALDKKATADGWKIIVGDEFSRSYRKKRRAASGRGETDFVTVLCLQEGERVLVCRQ